MLEIETARIFYGIDRQVAHLGHKLARAVGAEQQFFVSVSGCGKRQKPSNSDRPWLNVE